jgi:hypothetical protein
MEDLSLHILDIAENSLAAGARNLSITVDEDPAEDRLRIDISDDGKGMSAETVKKATDPFYTTRTTRRIGLGLALFQEAATAANGSMEIQSIPGFGTTVTATFQLSHIDRKPVGDMVETITALLLASSNVNVHYMHIRDGKKLVFDTRDIRNEIGSIPLNSVKAVSVIRGYLKQEEDALVH